MQTIVCMKWGNKYPSIFVNRLWSMIKRNTNRETRLICYTDDSSGIDSDIITRPIPDSDVPSGIELINRYRKILIWNPNISDLSGDVLFMDVDIVITGCIDSFFDYKPNKFCVIYNYFPRLFESRVPIYRVLGNTSVFRFPVGKYSNVYDNFISDPSAIFTKYEYEQEYVGNSIDDKEFWPSGWCSDYRYCSLPPHPLNYFFRPKLPKGSLCVIFPGRLNQDTALQGVYSKKTRLIKRIRPARWIADYWW